MKIISEEILINQGNFSKSEEYIQIHTQIYDAVKEVTWPEGSNIFAILPGHHANGVTPIKQKFIAHLKSHGWTAEAPLDLKATQSRPGNIDASIEVNYSSFAVEWETGNISSSHRALNKMTLGLLGGALLGGTLILPSRRLYPYLTDRIGSYSELEPYFPVWKAIQVENGILSVIVIEHDKIDNNVPPIPKGTDGRARG